MMKDEDKTLLKTMIIRANRGVEWSRPMDLGAWDASNHSARLRQLIKKGLVERQRRNSICNTYLQSSRGSYEYRITEAGRAALAALAPAAK
jgi:DNA-binding MarR family transcriptional regulator